MSAYFGSLAVTDATIIRPLMAKTAAQIKILWVRFYSPETNKGDAGIK